MSIESSSEEEDDVEGQEEQSLNSWMIRGSFALIQRCRDQYVRMANGERDTIMNCIQCSGNQTLIELGRTPNEDVGGGNTEENDNTTTR
ncbi:hypothetical protein C0J52_18139 [Blattella germanica]|nr:hypothetical protein C0J52_18139 [Blattella germanica]